MTSCELTSGFDFGQVGICAWSCCTFVPNSVQIRPLRKYSHFTKFDLVAVHVAFVVGSGGATHEGPFMVACKNLVGVGLVVF